MGLLDDVFGGFGGGGGGAPKFPAEGGAQLAARLDALVAPVGQAWEDALSSQPGLDLWQSDGIRPSRAGRSGCPEWPASRSTSAR